MEEQGVEPWALRMRSVHSTTELHPLNMNKSPANAKYEAKIWRRHRVNGGGRNNRHIGLKRARFRCFIRHCARQASGMPATDSEWPRDEYRLEEVLNDYRLLQVSRVKGIFTKHRILRVEPRVKFNPNAGH